MAEDRDYEVGYGKPPKHTRFVPGQSGFKGQRKRPETTAETIRRVRDELVTVNGKTMTKFELSIHSVVNQTIKSGKPRDLKVLLELLEQHGALPKAVEAAEARAAGEAVANKLFEYFDRTNEIDTADVEALTQLNSAESELIITCPHCGPELRRRWADPEYAELTKRLGQTQVHKQHLDAAERRLIRRSAT